MLNQQSWMFRRIFSVVFPRLIPKHILHNVKVVITDGDPQEFPQVDNAMENIIPIMLKGLDVDGILSIKGLTGMLIQHFHTFHLQW